jgi:integrase
MSQKYVRTKYRGVFLRNGIAYIRYAVPGKKRGSVVWESTGQRNVQLAVERLRQRKTEIAEGRYFPNRRFEKALFLDLAKYWWDHRGKQTNSKFEYRYPKIIEHFKDFLARDVTPEAIETFLHSLHQIEWVPVAGPAVYDKKAKRTRVAKKQVETDAPLSASSKNQYRTILSSIFSLNVRRGRYDMNPVEAVPQEKEPAGRDSLMMPDDFRRFRAKCQELGDYELDCFAVLATTTALRKGSILPRKWTDVHNLDGDLPFLMVPMTKNGEPKPAPLSDEAVETLKRLPSYGASEYLFPAKPNPRFQGNFKRPYAWDLGKRFRRVCRLIGIRAGFPGELPPRIHDWRHFSASVLLGKGVPDNIIAKHTGHRSKALERYKHLFPQLRQQTVQLIDSEVRIKPTEAPTVAEQNSGLTRVTKRLKKE